MPGAPSPSVLIFGASGEIGRELVRRFAADGAKVTAASRHPAEHSAGVTAMTYDPRDHSAVELKSRAAPGGERFDAVLWAQGANCNDSVLELDWERHMEVMEANCFFVIRSLNQLLEAGLLAEGGARLCVISSIWQTRARQNKFSYIVSKSALQGVVLSAATDLAEEGHLVNAILPGALHTPMTESMLSPAQVGALAGATKFNRLANLEDVGELAAFLCSPRNTSITGQFISIDLGFQNVRLV
jgi:NAD(P)-dependent dehydrogenase (short-subunit alcohol dehydrogenase family)